MKSGFKTIRIQWIALVLCCAFTWMVNGQVVLPQINARFANPSLDPETRQYFLDVELSTKSGKEALFGMNLRFFYDASVLEFEQVDQFREGYGILGEAPKAFVGNESSGTQLFGFSSNAGYVNGAIQLLDENYPFDIHDNKWVKAFRVSFKVPIHVPNPEEFCPSVIWDLKPQLGSGGFLPGGDGLLITVVDKDTRTRQESAPAHATGEPFNWKYNGQQEKPFGEPLATHCINISSLVAVEDPEHVDADGYALLQNRPNPFDQYTVIEFILPSAQHGKILLYDVSGAIREEIEGDFLAGKNKIELKQKTWMVQSNSVYYQLKTEKYTSKSRKMTLVRA